MNTAKKAAIVLAATGVAIGATAGAASAVGGSDKGAGSSVGAGGGAHASGVAAHSPGVVSGNLIQVPVAIPVQLVGNSVNVVGILNPAFGNTGVVQ